MTVKKKKPQNRNTFVKGILRRGSFHWKARNEALVAARVSRGKYMCKTCGDLFGPKEVILDHIQPVVDPKRGFQTWDEYINRLYCPVEGFQVQCVACSDAKTIQEDLMREHFKTERDELPDLKKVKDKFDKRAIDKDNEE